MGTLTKPFTFTAGTNAVAGQANSDLDTLYGWVNGGSAMWSDGSVPFTSPPAINADPSASTQAARKGYVDAQVASAITTAENFTNSTALRNVSGAGFYVAGGQVSVTTRADGTFNYAFPTPFPSSCFAAVFITPSNAGDLVGQIVPNGYNNLGFGGRIVNASTGSPPAAGAFIIHYIAFGT
jgi:hypothetical protein